MIVFQAIESLPVPDKKLYFGPYTASLESVDSQTYMVTTTTTATTTTATTTTSTSTCLEKRVDVVLLLHTSHVSFGVDDCDTHSIIRNFATQAIRKIKQLV